ncbi:serine/threonine-protein kinase [Nonomuraea sp. NPDC050022]|uniref:serine/threonine-protein kinase n=1 Tax=unclassified Nonomuraea TaxID=2593643 RepID=UPI003407331F
MPEPLYPDDPPAIGPYRLIGRLGAGGQGVVYLGQARDGRYVAVKVLHDAVSDQVLERFAKEVAAARRVEPFCVAQVLDASFEGRRPYIVTEFVEGLSLQQAGVHHGPALHRMAVSTATALAAVHRAGIVHRDFKPANVLLAKDGPRVIDFGIARDTEASLTVTSSIVGTPSYMAPEQLGGHYTGPATDVFAWGSVMVYAATGRPPFGVDHLPAVISRILYAAPDLGDMAEPLRSIVTSCLAKEPSRRPTMQDVLLQLLGQQRVRPIAPSELVADTRPTVRSTPLRTGLLVGGTAVVVTSVTVTVTLLLGLPGGGSNRAADGATSSPVAEASESQGKQAQDPSTSTPKKSSKSSPTRPSPTNPTRSPTESTPPPANSTPEAIVFGSLVAQGSKRGTCYESGVRVRFRGRILDDVEPIGHRWVLDGREMGMTTSYSPKGPFEVVTREGFTEPGTHTATFWLLRPGTRRSRTISIKVC